MQELNHRYRLTPTDRKNFKKLDDGNYLCCYLTCVFLGLENLTDEIRNFFKRQAKKRFGTTDYEELTLIAYENDIEFVGGR